LFRDSEPHARDADGCRARAPNLGHGHPLRPEYVLTETGERLAPVCLDLVDELRRRGFEDAGLKKWSMPVVLVLAEAAGESRFSELRAALPGVTARALSLALEDLGAATLVAVLARLRAQELKPETRPPP
jgi:DNA-binding HxlR family transcriptional regulator